MKKVLFTLNIGNYAPEITELTYPFFRKYAERIEAEFVQITKRRYQDWPMDYEKLQIYDLAREIGADWNIYIDSDALIHPDFFDITEHVTKDTVLHNGADKSWQRWRYDNYFRRDGRHISSCNWFAMASDWCLDLWHPIEDMTPEEAIANIFPYHAELTCQGTVGINRSHLISDYALSRNIARYGLKFTTVNDMLQQLDPKGWYLYHEYTISRKEKYERIKKLIFEPRDKENGGWGLRPKEELVTV